MPDPEDFYSDWAATWLNKGTEESSSFEKRHLYIQTSQAYSALAQTIILRKMQRELEYARKST